MERLRVDEVLRLLPELDELRPLVEGVLATSVPDEAHRWTAAGELETVGQRVVSAARLERELPAQLERVQVHLSRIYKGVANAIRALQDGDRPQAATELVGLAEAEETEGRPERAEAYARAAYELVQGEREHVTAIHALRTAARAARSQGRLEVSSRDYESAFDTAVDAGEVGHAVISAIGRGNVAVDRGRWESARGWYLRALERIGDEPERAVERWQVCVDLSIATRQLGDLESSRAWLQRAEEDAAELDGESAEAITANAWGRLYQIEGRLDDAEAAFRRALGAARDAKARVTIGVNLGEALLALNRSMDAAEVARVAEARALGHRVSTKLPEVYRLLGQIAVREAHEDAFVFFERALAIVREQKLPAFERAETLEAYAHSGHGERPAVRARLEEAASIYEGLGNAAAVARVSEALHRLGPDAGNDEGA